MQAIEASLSTNDAEDKFEELQSEDLILIDDRCAIRALCLA